MWNKLPYHSVMCDMRYIHNGIHMHCEIHFAFEDRNMAPVPRNQTIDETFGKPSLQAHTGLDPLKNCK